MQEIDALARQTAASSFSVLSFIPAFAILLAALALFIAAWRAHRRLRPCALPLFLALNALTLGVSLGLDLCPSSLPAPPRELAPAAFTCAYLLLGGLFRHATLWGAGLATPLLWFAAQRLDASLLHLSRFTVSLPQDPAWFLLCAALLFAFTGFARTRQSWEDLEPPALTAGFCYALAGIGRICLGEPGVLALAALPPVVWALSLHFLALIGLWFSRLLGDWPLAACCGLGFLASLYALIASLAPWFSG